MYRSRSNLIEWNRIDVKNAKDVDVTFAGICHGVDVFPPRENPGIHTCARNFKIVGIRFLPNLAEVKEK